MIDRKPEGEGGLIRKGHLPNCGQIVLPGVQREGFLRVTKPKQGGGGRVSYTSKLFPHLMTKFTAATVYQRKGGNQESTCGTNQQHEPSLQWRNLFCWDTLLHHRSQLSGQGRANLRRSSGWRKKGPRKTLKVIISWLEKLQAEVEVHRRESPGSSQTNQSSDRVKAHTCNLGTWRAVSSGYRRHWREGTRWAWNSPNPEEPGRLLGGTQQTGHGRTMEGQAEEGWEDKSTAACQEPLKAAGRILDKVKEVRPSWRSCKAAGTGWWT